jgi:hypothetical protein
MNRSNTLFVYTSSGTGYESGMTIGLLDVVVVTIVDDLVAVFIVKLSSLSPMLRLIKLE